MAIFKRNTQQNGAHRASKKGEQQSNSNIKSTNVNLSKITKLVSSFKCNNRVYYESQFDNPTLLGAGVLQEEQKAKYDRVVLANAKNEIVNLFGFAQNSSTFKLKISIASLFPNSQIPEQESKWRLANVQLSYFNIETNSLFEYHAEEALDYSEKRRTANLNQSRNVYKIGALTYEIVVPFALGRVHLNSIVKRTCLTTNEISYESVKLTVSTHPTSDKFDYRYRFDADFLSKRIFFAAEDAARAVVTTTTAPTTTTNDINVSTNNVVEHSVAGPQMLDANKLLNSMLEDRIDTPSMFRLKLTRLDSSNLESNQKSCLNSIMWGAKIKNFVDVSRRLINSSSDKRLPISAPIPSPLAASSDDLASFSIDSDDIERLFIWTECPIQIHLNQLKKHPNCIYGMVHNNYDYSSPLSDVKLFVIDDSDIENQAQTIQETNENNQDGQQLVVSQEPLLQVTNERKIEVRISELNSLASLTHLHQLVVKAYGIKEYKISLAKDDVSDEQSRLCGKPFKVNVNGFEGYALIDSPVNAAKYFQRTQQRLWTLNISDENLTHKIASEALLGGKGYSLVQLSTILNNSLLSQAKLSSNIDIGVPRALIVSCSAYDLWLKSNPIALAAINELDAARRALAARSVCINKLDDRYASVALNQSALEERCARTCQVLMSCALPLALQSHLRAALQETFVPNCNDNTYLDDGHLSFAIRSSAVGEDANETSAAGQMSTKLAVRGFESICNALVECWTSQFSLAAVTYKSQNGLAINAPMAVVIQELANCVVAGVATTCDPLTGNANSLLINANFGLGESVVSGRCVPDSIKINLNGLLNKEAKFERLLTESDIKQRANKEVGDKRERVEALSSGGTAIVENSQDKANECSLNDEQLTVLSNILLILRQNSSIKEREIEWGITWITADGQEHTHSVHANKTKHKKSLGDKLSNFFHNVEQSVEDALGINSTKSNAELNDQQQDQSGEINDKSAEEENIITSNDENKDDDNNESGDNKETNETDPNNEVTADLEAAEVNNEAQENEEREQQVDDEAIQEKEEKQDEEEKDNIQTLNQQATSQQEQQVSFDEEDNVVGELAAPSGEIAGFRVHLLQSRPLTNLSSLSTNEIDHELDSGFAGPLEFMSRANLGEVFPGSMSPLGLTFMKSFCWLTSASKPYSSDHTISPYAGTTFAHIANILMFAIFNGDFINKLRNRSAVKNIDLMSIMLGTRTEVIWDLPLIEDLCKERVSPLVKSSKRSIFATLGKELGFADFMLFASKLQSNVDFEKNLTQLEPLIASIESASKSITNQEPEIELNNALSLNEHQFDNQSIIALATAGAISKRQVYAEILALFNTITTNVLPLQKAWFDHINASIMSMTLNALLLQLLSRQDAYKNENSSATQILSDFSALLASVDSDIDKSSVTKTEGGDICDLMTKIVDLLVEKNELLAARELSDKQLYALLMGDNGLKSKVFKQFIEKNAHRGYKEFDIGAPSWSDDASFLIKALRARMLAASPNKNGKSSRDSDRKSLARQIKLKADEILDKKVQPTAMRVFISKYVIPRAKHSVSRREKTKSAVIATVHKFRRAFRHLACLLCLDGRLPTVETAFYLTIDELRIVVQADELSRSDFPRLLTKARRRQQQASILDRIVFDEPTLRVDKAMTIVDRATGELDASTPLSARLMGNVDEIYASLNKLGFDLTNVPHVLGMPSCAGCVTAKCVVVNSIHEVDLIEANTILVTYSIDICWSPYFPILRGIVTEIGAVVSHGAVIAREYNLPTLCTALGACATFKTGQILTLDATNGVCYLADNLV